MAKPKSKSVRLAEFPLQRFCMVEDLRPRWDETRFSGSEKTHCQERIAKVMESKIAKIW